jgi:hypothetical protein
MRSGQQQPVYKRYHEYDSYGNDLSTSTSCSIETCCARLCNSTAGCVAYVWAYDLPLESNWHHYCWLKAAANPQPLSAGQSWATTGLMVGVRGECLYHTPHTLGCSASDAMCIISISIVDASWPNAYQPLLISCAHQHLHATARPCLANTQALLICEALHVCQHAIHV